MEDLGAAVLRLLGWMKNEGRRGDRELRSQCSVSVWVTRNGLDLASCIWIQVLQKVISFAFPLALYRIDVASYI